MLTVEGGGGLFGFMFGLAFALIPFLLILLLTLVVSRPKTPLAAFVIATPAVVGVFGLLAFQYHTAFTTGLDAQSGLVAIFAPVYALPVAVIAWLATWGVVVLGGWNR
jgi:hypothetical protein